MFSNMALYSYVAIRFQYSSNILLALTVSFERPNYIVTEGDGIVKIGVLVTGSTDLTLVAG